MASNTIRVSKAAYIWIKKHTGTTGGRKMSTTRVVDMLISHFDNTYDKYVVTDETKELQQRLSSIVLSIEHLEAEKQTVIDDLSLYEVDEDVIDDDIHEGDELFEEIETTTPVKNNTLHEKMMKTKLF